ncbi:hypothetical protein [Salegentibacter sp. F14]
MKKINFGKEKKLYDLLENELDIYYDLSFIRSRTLEELNLTKPEIDLFLNKFENIYEVCIEEWEIEPKITLVEFIKKLLSILNEKADASGKDF